jgi:molybdopterin-guanine dinucleotide biosynthesis protein A
MPMMPAGPQTGKEGAPGLTGAILAGGFSRRLGQDKATLTLGGKPLALWVHEALAPLVSICWLITNQPLDHLNFGLPLVPDLLAERAARAHRTSRPAVICRSPWGLEPFPGVYSVRLLPILADFLQADRRPTRFLEACRPQILSEKEVLALDPQALSFFNLNTPQDLHRAEAWLAGEAPLRDAAGLVKATGARSDR